MRKITLIVAGVFFLVIMLVGLIGEYNLTLFTILAVGIPSVILYFDSGAYSRSEERRRRKEDYQDELSDEYERSKAREYGRREGGELHRKDSEHNRRVQKSRDKVAREGIFR